MYQNIDIVGCRFGCLTVIKRVQNAKGYKKQYLCQCDCGNFKIIRKSDLVTQKTKSCGCLRKKIAKEKGINNKTHGKTNTRLYKIWQGIKSRCYYKKHIEYKNYGGRGINVYFKWKNDFISFYNWAINNGYKNNLTIDRIDVNGNYEPNNCRWVNMKTQENNRSNNRKIKYKDKIYTLSQLSEKINISSATLAWRINNDWEEKELDLPINLNNKTIRKENKK